MEVRRAFTEVVRGSVYGQGSYTSASHPKLEFLLDSLFQWMSSKPEKYGVKTSSFLSFTPIARTQDSIPFLVSRTAKALA